MIHETISAEKLLAKLHGSTPRNAVEFRAAHTWLAKDEEKKLAHHVSEPIPKFRMVDEGIDKHQVAKFIEDELDLDGKPALNLASFVNTYIDDNAMKLCMENITKNLADGDEYPALMLIHQRCVSMLSNLWNVPKGMTGVGTATTGSSEAIHLGGLAMKKRWEDRQKAKGRDIRGVTPNIVMGANAQVALEKFARYFDVTARIIDIDPETDYGFNPKKLKESLDEDTIGVFVILGSTYTGHYQDVKAVSDVLDEYEAETGHDIPIHVDGASGAFVAPFCSPELEWDFRTKRVNSINTSGHKFGLTTAGLGWIIWKDRQFLPEGLLFVLHYLGGSEETYTLNFSRPGFPVIHQYYNLVVLGKDGFRELHGTSLSNARLLSRFLEESGYFEVLSDVHRKYGVKGVGSERAEDLTVPDHEYYNPGLPVVAFRFSKDFRDKYPMIPQQAVSTLLRVRGYIIPNYNMPPSVEDVEVLRIVVRASLTVDFLDMLMEDIINVVQRLIKAVEGHSTETSESDKVYKTILALTLPNSQDYEHPNLWEVSEESGTRQRHGTKC